MSYSILLYEPNEENTHIKNAWAYQIYPSMCHSSNPRKNVEYLFSATPYYTKECERVANQILSNNRNI